MNNENKVVTAGPEGFTVYYIDSRKHFNYKYHQPLLPYLKKLQVYGESYKGKRYQQFELDEFTPYQNRLYKDAVYGLSSYTITDLKKMSISEKVEIKKINKLAQRILNEWKQEIVSKLVDDFLLNVFYNSRTVKKMIMYSYNYTCEKVVNHLSFAELNISKRHIALKLMEQKILPDNFFLAAA